ncbi:MAG: alpha/beta fold hydrolase [Rhizobiales bacterium]|nr:alpha/beta fold hydrolase [Hyphomicrobiales bacterium]
MHGIGGNKRNWHDNLPAFASHWHSVAWDARGYGESDDYEGPLTFSDFSHDLIRVLDHFGAGQAHIVGLSMGGRIALDFAALYPERLLTLTLCDTHRGFSHFSEEKRREFIRLRKEPLVSGGEPQDIAVPVAKTLAGPNASKESFDALVDSMSRLHKESYIKTIEASAMAGNHGELADIGVPTHVIVGAEDRLTTPDTCRELAGMIPGARFTVIADAGHLVNIEKPAEFNAAAIAFIRSARK